MKKIILLNGPPGAGKDYFGSLLQQRLSATGLMLKCRLHKFAGVLKEMVHAAFHSDYPQYLPLPADFYEDVKEIPNEDFGGAVPRKAYIQFSEGFIKPLLGNDYFGKVVAKHVREQPNPIAVITDSGFVEEAQVLIDEFGAENVLLVRLHRNGHTFEGDSRSHLYLPVSTLDFVNAATPESDEEFIRIVTECLESQLGQPPV